MDKDRYKNKNDHDKHDKNKDRKKSSMRSMDDEEIYDGDEVTYDDKNYIVMYVGKDGIEWELHPAGTNPDRESKDMSKIDSNKKMKVRNRGIDKHNKRR